MAGKWFSTSSHFMMENTIDELGPCWMLFENIAPSIFFHEDRNACS
jgi:hypothetical protein